MADDFREYYTDYELAYILAKNSLPNHPLRKMDDPKYFNAIEVAILEGWLKQADMDWHETGTRILEQIYYGYHQFERESMASDIDEEWFIPKRLFHISDIRQFLNNHPEFGKPHIFYPELPLLVEHNERIAASQDELAALPAVAALKLQVENLQSENKYLKEEIEKNRQLCQVLNDEHPTHSKKLALAIQIWIKHFGPYNSREEFNAGPSVENILDAWENNNGAIPARAAIGRIIGPRDNEVRSRKRK